MKVVSTLQEYWNVTKDDRKDFCLGEELLSSYPTQDNYEPLVNVLELFQNESLMLLYNPPKEIGEAKIPLQLRMTPAKMLVAAAKKLPESFVFDVSEGYRPLWYQRQIFDEIFTEMKEKNPGKPEKEVWAETTLYVADPTLTPPHSTGGTFDLTLAKANGERIDMGNPMNTVGEMSNTFVTGLTKEQEANRRLLFDTLTGVGFVNLASEWWHYSYGDQYWAIYNEEQFAIYGSVKEEKK